MKRINVGIIGCGAIAESEHLPNILSIPQAKLVAICDINEKRLEDMGNRFNVEKRFTSHKELLEDKDVEAVVIATPAPTHAEIVLNSLNHGKNVFVEKPVTTTMEDAEKVVELSKKLEIPVMVGYQLRFLPNHQKVKEYIEKKVIGKIYTAHIRAETLVIKPDETLLIDFATHFFDLMRWYFDKEKIDSILGSIKNNDNGMQVASTTTLNYNSGFHSTIETVWVPKFNWGIVNRTFEAIGEDGKINTKLTGPEINLWRANSLRDRIMGIKTFNPKQTTVSFMPLSDYCYREELRAFIDAVLRKKPMPVTAEDGLKDLQIADATLQSYKKKTVVDVQW